MRLVPRLELNVITGFLGSGKTTLLKRYLQEHEPETALVIINEFGKESIDDRLTLHLNSEIETIADGCLCCTVIDKLRDTLLQVLARRARGELKALHRIVVETSGLADPAPILGTILSDENLNEYIELGPCVATFDALEGIDTLERFQEAAAQLAAADRVILTKTDLADSARIETLVTAVRSVNPLCEVTLSDVPAKIFTPMATTTHRRPLATSPAHQHTTSIQSFSTVVSSDVDWATFSVWLTALLNRHGNQILRFKSVIALPDSERLVVQGVRHRVYPPQHLPPDSDDDGLSRLVFITEGIEHDRIKESLRRLTSASAQRQVGRGLASLVG